MGKPAWVGLVSAIVLAFICGGIYAFTERGDVAQATPPEVDTIIGVDANPAGNTATSLGTINGCISVESVDTGPGVPGPTFYIDLVIQEVTNLNYFDGTFRFDESVLEVNSLDADDFFLGSNVYPVLECYPGQCTVSNGDQSHEGHTGEGVLARLEITAIGAGISEANYDLRPDGVPVSFVYLEDPTGTPIGDLDGDRHFDGDILNAQIAVDEYCPGECNADVDTDSDGFNDDVECYLSTDSTDDCTDDPGTHDAWPVDVNIDARISVVGDVLSFRGRIGARPGDDGWWQRLDLNMDGTLSVVGDVLTFRGLVGQECS
jgi:hypothetical protein